MRTYAQARKPASRRHAVNPVVSPGGQLATLDRVRRVLHPPRLQAVEALTRNPAGAATDERATQNHDDGGGGGSAASGGPAAAPACRCRLRRGPTYTPSGTIRARTTGGQKVALFNLAASFENDPVTGKCPRCCEVRQFIRWDRRFARVAGGPPHSGFPATATASTWHEDRDTADTRYGHRSGAHSAPGAGCFDEYLTGTTQDQANGDTYCGRDQPFGLTTDRGSWSFQLRVIDTCNGNVVRGRSSLVRVRW